MNIKEEAYRQAIETIKKSTHSTGFYASGLKGGYEALWSRDSMITTLGASTVKTTFKKTISESISLLKKWQTKNGQIPNCVGSYNIDRRSTKTYNSIDSSLWYVIGNYVYAHAYRDHSIIQKNKNSIAKTLVWLRHQDPNEDGLLAQQPTMDWQDAFPHKYGHVLNTQALYYAVLKIVGDNKRASHLKSVVNGKTEKYLSLFNEELGYYLPWNWKNHDGDREQEEWFDGLGNVLAIIFGLADTRIAKSILNHIEKEGINKPYGCKAIWPPIKPGDKEWRSYFSKCDAREPYHYLNGGIWPFIGNFLVVALIKMKRYEQAEEELMNQAKAVLQRIPIRDLPGEYPMNEWLHGLTGEAMGEPHQAWTAATYIYAYECLKKKKVIYF